MINTDLYKDTDIKLREDMAVNRRIKNNSIYMTVKNHEKKLLPDQYYQLLDNKYKCYHNITK